MNKDKTKLIKKLELAAIIIAAIIAITCIFEFAFAGNKNNKSIVNQSGGAMLSLDCKGVELIASPIALADYEAYGISPAAETAYTLTATVKPDSLRNKELDWEMKFQNGGSEWAQGKTEREFVTLNVEEDTHSAKLQCLKPFGERIVVTVTSRQDNSKKATCILDYKQKISSFDVKLDRVTYIPHEGRFEYFKGQKLRECRVFPDYEQEYSAEFKIILNASEAYTIAAEPIKYYCEMSPTEEFINALNDAGLDGAAAKTYTFSDSDGYSGTINDFFDKAWCAAICDGNESAETRDKLLYTIIDNESIEAYTFKIYDRAGGELKHSYDIRFDTMTVIEQIVVESVEMDNNNLIF